MKAIADSKKPIKVYGGDSTMNPAAYPDAATAFKANQIQPLRGVTFSSGECQQGVSGCQLVALLECGVGVSPA